MYARDYRDLIAGGLLIVGGLWAGGYAVSNFDVGSPSRMGPGMFPAALGFLLAGLGVLVALPALFRPGLSLPVIEWRPLLMTFVGVLTFSLTVTTFGMVPAIFLLTIAAAMADTKLGPLGTVLLAAALCFIAWVIFRVGLGIVLEPFRWPF